MNKCIAIIPHGMPVEIGEDGMPVYSSISMVNAMLYFWSAQQVPDAVKLKGLHAANFMYSSPLVGTKEETLCKMGRDFTREFVLRNSQDFDLGEAISFVAVEHDFVADSVKTVCGTF